MHQPRYWRDDEHSVDDFPAPTVLWLPPQLLAREWSDSRKCRLGHGCHFVGRPVRGARTKCVPVDNSCPVDRARLRRAAGVASGSVTPPPKPPSVDELLAAAVGAVPGGEPRSGQQRMVAAVQHAVDSGEHLLVQAGTGTGKSLAYLVPTLLVDGPVVVSTATLALQSQLVDHDLPRLADAVEPLLGRRPTFAVLKGRHHYACLARLEGTTEEEPEDALFETSGTR